MFHYNLNLNWHIFAREQLFKSRLHIGHLLTAEAPIAHLPDHLQRVLHELVHVHQQLLLGPGHLLVSHSPPAVRTPPRPPPCLGLSPQPPPEHRSAQRHYIWHTPEAATLPSTEAAAALRTRLLAPYFTLGQEPEAEDTLQQDYCSCWHNSSQYHAHYYWIRWSPPA